MSVSGRVRVRTCQRSNQWRRQQGYDRRGVGEESELGGPEETRREDPGLVRVTETDGDLRVEQPEEVIYNKFVLFLFLPSLPFLL